MNDTNSTTSAEHPQPTIKSDQSDSSERARAAQTVVSDMDNPTVQVLIEEVERLQARVLTLKGILQNVSNDIHANNGYVTTSIGGLVDLELMRGEW